MIKVDKQNLIDIIDKKYKIQWQKWCHKYLIHFVKTKASILEYLKVDNSFQRFAKKTSDRILLILLVDKCLREIFKSLRELFQALIALTTIEFLP